MTQQTQPQTQQTRPLADRSPEEIATFLEEQQAAYAALKDKGLKLDLTRGKPSTAQLDLSDELLTLPKGVRDGAGVDVRNYGGLEGIRDLRAMFAELLWLEPEQVVAGGNSSLVMMREVLTDLWLKGGVDSERPWGQEEKVTFICPVPGYDRHFTLLSWFGIEMVTVPMNDDGPDAEAVARLAGSDPSIKGIWIVPTYANPSGAVVSQEVAARLTSMETAAPDFKIFWDNAYAFHHLTEDEAKSADVLTLAAAAGHPHRPIMFASTSKITYAGAGVAFLGRLGRDREVVRREPRQGRHRARQAQPAAPPAVLRHPRRRAGPHDAAPRDHRAQVRRGGAHPHRAARRPRDRGVDPPDRWLLRQPRRGRRAPPRGWSQLAKEAGIALTPAGSSFPNGDDPRDRNIRLAPTFPELAEVSSAMEAVATCVLLAAAEQHSG